jgi:hypothetical protein
VWLLLSLQVAPNYPIVRNNLAVALTDLGTTLKVRGQLKTGQHGSFFMHHAVLLFCTLATCWPLVGVLSVIDHD